MNEEIWGSFFVDWIGWEIEKKKNEKKKTKIK